MLENEPTNPASRLMNWWHNEKHNGYRGCFQVTICPAWMVTARRGNPCTDAALPRPGQAVILAMSITVPRGVVAVPRFPAASSVNLTINLPRRTDRNLTSKLMISHSHLERLSGTLARDSNITDSMPRSMPTN